MENHCLLKVEQRAPGRLEYKNKENLPQRCLPHRRSTLTQDTCEMPPLAPVTPAFWDQQAASPVALASRLPCWSSILCLSSTYTCSLRRILCRSACLLGGLLKPGIPRLGTTRDNQMAKDNIINRSQCSIIRTQLSYCSKP